MKTWKCLVATSDGEESVITVEAEENAAPGEVASLAADRYAAVLDSFGSMGWINIDVEGEAFDFVFDDLNDSYDWNDDEDWDD